MGRLFKSQWRDLFSGLALVVAAAGLVRWPTESMDAAREGLSLCGNVIFPSLFPFFVLSSLVVELGLGRYLGKVLEPVMRPLFRLNGNCASALALGLIGGYPVGARTAISLYQAGQCSKTEAQRLLAFCSNSGPAFIFGVVGAGVFGSSRVGLLLFLIHLCASLLVGVLFRFYRPNDHSQSGKAAPVFQAAPFAPALTRAVTGGLSAALNICAFVLFFTVMLRCLTLSGALGWLSGFLAGIFAPLGLTQPWIQKLLVGLLEVSSGVSALGSGGGLTGRVSLAAFMLGWAGLSVHCQVLSFLAESCLSIRTYLTGKLLHGGLSALLTALVLHWFPLDDAASCLAGQVESLADLELGHTFPLSLCWALGVWLVFFLMSGHLMKKRGGKVRRRAL